MRWIRRTKRRNTPKNIPRKIRLTNRRQRKKTARVKDELQKRLNTLIKEKGAYAMTLIVIVGILLSVNFPVYLMVFFGVFVFFVWKAFSQPPRNEIRGIFEFYLAANEMLRDDEKRWFGFEMQEVLHSGERVLNTMPDPPPLMLF